MVFKYEWILTFFLHIVVIQSSLFQAAARGTGTGEYLYEGQDEAQHVIEYVEPETTTENDKITLPDFISSPDNGDRIVELYSPTCGWVILEAFIIYYPVF